MDAVLVSEYSRKFLCRKIRDNNTSLFFSFELEKCHVVLVNIVKRNLSKNLKTPYGTVVIQDSKVKLYVEMNLKDYLKIALTVYNMNAGPDL